MSCFGSRQHPTGRVITTSFNTQYGFNCNGGAGDTPRSEPFLAPPSKKGRATPRCSQQGDETMKGIPHRLLLSATAAALLTPWLAQAQEAKSEDKPKNVEIDKVIVTGTATLRAGLDTPLSVTSLGSKVLERVSASSQADILATLPGIKAEGGGGEVATNVQVRGLPSSGQYQFTPLLYDGMPVLSTFGLNSSAYDVYMRNDLGVARLEFVAGGVSNLFGPGSVAGLLNYISKVGGDAHKGTLKTEIAEDNRLRQDVFFSGPLSANTFYAVSGFYRTDKGPLRSGLDSKGGQLRANLKHTYQGGSVSGFAQVIDDKVQYFLPIPLLGGSLERATGSDGATVYTVNTAQAAGLTSVLPNGVRYSSPISDGVSTRGGSLGLVWDHDLGNDFSLNGKVKYSSYAHQFNLFLDGDGIGNVPETQAQFMANRKISGPATFTYVDNGQALEAGTLLFGNRVLNRDRPIHDASAELNISRRLEVGAVAHSLTLGAWLARSTAEDNSLTQMYLGEFRNAPRLVNLTANGVAYTAKGLLDPSVGYTRNRHTASRTAIYLADQMEAKDWALDLGIRVERLRGDLHRELTQTYTGLSQGGTNESAALTSAVYGKGTYQDGAVSSTETAASIGGLYKLGGGLNVYANYSRGFFFPEIRSVSFNSLSATSSYEGERINQAEMGLKLSRGGFFGSAALFYSTLKNRRSVQFQNTGGGGVAEVVTLLSTKAPGIELNASYQLTASLNVNGNLTYSAHEISDGPLQGNRLERKPKSYANASLVYDDGSLDAILGWNYQADAFANNANTAVLPSYSLWRVGAGYKFGLGKANESIRVSLSVFNVTNSQGLAEGSPRQAASQTAGGAYFVGRPILPRRVTLSVAFSY